MSTASGNPRLSGGIIFSDGAIRETVTNKLSVIGAFQIFNASAFPFQSPPFNVTVLVEDIPVGRQVVVRVSLRNAEGNELGFTTGMLRINTLIEPRAHTDLALPFPSMIFQSVGDYAMLVFVDEQEIGRKTLFVRSIPQMQTQMP